MDFYLQFTLHGRKATVETSTFLYASAQGTELSSVLQEICVCNSIEKSEKRGKWQKKRRGKPAKGACSRAVFRKGNTTCGTWGVSRERPKKSGQEK